MATRQLGKLKIRFQDGGLDFRWGDGEIRHIGRQKKKSEDYDYADSYGEYDQPEGTDYEDRYSDSDGYYEEDRYDEADAGFADYSEDGYADSPYDDGYDGGYDDGYDDGYGDYADGADDYESGYDDGYSDDPIDDGYGDYPPYDGDYADEYAPEETNAFLQYIDENDWVTYLLLVLLPPLGIYLLWRRQRFEPMIRYSVMAAAAVWFVVMIVLIATQLFSGHNDGVNTPQLPTLQPTATVTATVTPEVSASTTPNSSAATQTSPSATPIGGSATASVAQGSVVWVAASGNFYHSSESCSLAAGATLTQTTVENAKNRGKYACPECYGGDVYYATSGGTWYHLNKTCNNMSNAEMYSLEQAKDEGKTACPVCVTKTQTTLTTASAASLTFVTSSTTDKSGIKVWCTSGGVNYHTSANCRNMSGASQVSLKDALLAGKTACSTCCAAAGTEVWCTKGGTYYHTISNCSSMSGAKKVTLAEALVLGKKECSTCHVSVSATAASGSSSASSTTSSGEEYYVYATKNGKYYHVKQNCQGMEGASKVTLKSMLEAGRAACPECCSGASMTVYATKGGTYYHSYATCSDMSNAKSGTLAEALASGYKRCPYCWGESSSTTSSSSSASSASTATSDTVMVYATTNGKYYHTKSNCSGMTNARHITLTQAMNEGKTACATCAATASVTVYSTSGGKYYHKASTCEHMDNGVKRTLAEALKMGQTACPVCMTTSSTSTESSETLEKVANFTVGTSGIKVYASATQAYYHTSSSCASGLTQVALETALNYGKQACTKCCSTASETVYATKNGKYYHISKSCAGSGASKGTLAYALAYGFTPCPFCVSSDSSSESTSSGTYESGRSGINVYATSSGTYYHTDKSCAGSGAVKVTLETALNYGKKACQECCAVADRTVYAVQNSFYYHASKDCAGSNAVKGTYAKALAYGLTACPYCIGGASDQPEEGPEYSASADSSVYIDLYDDQFYYHKSSKCSDCGMSDGTEVTLAYAIDFGYKRCPYCNPASSVD